MTEVSPETKSLLVGLVAAGEEGWSGMLKVQSRDEQVGVIVMKEGNIAWAVCKYQREDLGTFLMRRGHVTAEQLREVRERYEALGKTRKLVSLMEEAGIADRETLRAALLKHIRRALACMIALPESSIAAVVGDMMVDETLIFSLEELLPEFEEDEDPALTLGRQAYQDSIVDLSIHEEILSELSDVPSYRGSLIGAVDGRLFAGHGFERNASGRALKVGVPANALQSATQNAEHLGLGRLEQIVFECDEGWLFVRWLDRESKIFLAVFLGDGARVGIARHRIAAAAENLRLYISSMYAEKRVSL